jgi:hypothetical protein
MRYFLVTLLLLSYPGLLIAVYWLPSSGPRQVLSLSVAKDGSFTTSSADVHFHQKAIDFWAPDLTHKKTINSSGYLVGRAHALSPDGNTVAVITTDGRSQIIEVVSVADDTLEVAIDAPKELSGLGNLHFCGSSESILLAEGNDAFVFSQDGKLNQQLPHCHTLRPAMTCRSLSLLVLVYPATKPSIDSMMQKPHLTDSSIRKNVLPTIGMVRVLRSDWMEQ